jgi:hypothetical protein
MQSQRLSSFANSSIAQVRLVWFFLASGLSWTLVPTLYTRPCSAVIDMERNALDLISCLTILRTLQSLFPDGEPSQALNAFSSMPTGKKIRRMCPDYLWLQSQMSILHLFSAANSIIRTKGPQPADVDNRIVAFKICSIWHQKSDVSSLFHDGVSSKQPVFYRCPSAEILLLSCN